MYWRIDEWVSAEGCEERLVDGVAHVEGVLVMNGDGAADISLTCNMDDGQI